MFEVIPNLHPPLVHFPIALIAVAAIFLLVARSRSAGAKAGQWAIVGHWALWLSALSAIAAVLSGWQAFATVNHDDAGHLAMEAHRAWALPTTVVLVIVAAIDWGQSRADQPASWSVTIIVAFLLGAVAVTGWLGGETVYRHGIGVVSIPCKPDTAHEHDGHDHAHTEGDSGVAPPKQATPAKHDHHPDGSTH